MNSLKTISQAVFSFQMQGVMMGIMRRRVRVLLGRIHGRFEIVGIEEIRSNETWKRMIQRFEYLEYGTYDREAWYKGILF